MHESCVVVAVTCHVVATMHDCISTLRRARQLHVTERHRGAGAGIGLLIDPSRSTRALATLRAVRHALRAAGGEVGRA